MSNVTGSFYTSNSNLENLIPAQADITDITQRITGITYDGITDTTTIDNNVTITVPHVLTLNGINVYQTINNNTTAIAGLDTRVTNVETILTDVSYNSLTDTTTIDNNVLIQGSKTLTLNGQNVNTRFTNLETILTDISYNSLTDTTTIANNVVIPTGKTLTLNGGDVDAQITALEDKTTGIFYNFTFNETLVDHDLIVAIGSELYVNGQDVNSRFNTIENNINGITYNAGTTTTTISNPNIILNGLIDASGNNLTDIGNIYVNAGGAVYVGGTPINTSALLSTNNTWSGTNNFSSNDCRVALQLVNTDSTLAASTSFVQQQFTYFIANNNTWTGQNNFTANDCRVATQLANTSSTLAASTDFVMNQFDWFTSNSQIYTNASATQNFTNSNITVPTQSNADNSQKASNSAYVNNKFTQFRTDNQTINGTITFSSQPYISSSIPALDRSTRITTTGAVARDMGTDPIGYRTYFDDFYNQGIYFGQERDNDVFTCRDANIQYQVNTNANVSYIPYFQSINSQTAGHPGILACYTGGAAGRYAILNWYTNLYPFNTSNLGSYECVVMNASSSTLNYTFYCRCGMTDQLFNNTNGYFWFYDAGAWKAQTVIAGTTTTYGTTPAFVDPLRNKWIKLRIDFFVSGANITINWYYNNLTDNTSNTYTTTITNISGIDLGPTFRLEAGNSTEVIMYLDCQVVKYHADRN